MCNKLYMLAMIVNCFPRPNVEIHIQLFSHAGQFMITSTLSEIAARTFNLIFDAPVAEAYTTQPNRKAGSRVLYVYLACMAG